MSAMDAITILYHRFMKLDVNNPDMEDRDRFVLSKGHAAVGYGPVICDYGFMPVEGLHNLKPDQFQSLVCTWMRTRSRALIVLPALWVTAFPLADGFALAGRVKGQDYMVYCLTGDGELNEGSNWEAAMTAAQFKLSSVVVLVDNNKCVIDGRVDDDESGAAG